MEQLSEHNYSQNIDIRPGASPDHRPEITLQRQDILIHRPDISVQRPDITHQRQDITLCRPDVNNLQSPEITAHGPEVKGGSRREDADEISQES